MKKEWNAVEILRHSRHDWLNKLQLIKGNLCLNRLDRVHQIIEEILIETKNEAKLSNLNAPQFATLLLLFNWENHRFSLEVEVVGKEFNLSKYDQQLTEWCTEFLQILDQSIEEYAENFLFVTVNILDENVGFHFDFRGMIRNKNDIVKFMQRSLEHSILDIVAFHIEQQELAVDVNLHKN